MPIFPLYNQICRFHIPMLKIIVCYTINFVTLWIAEGQISTFTYFSQGWRFLFLLELSRAQSVSLVLYILFLPSTAGEKVFRMLNTFKCFDDMSVKSKKLVTEIC